LGYTRGKTGIKAQKLHRKRQTKEQEQGGHWPTPETLAPLSTRQEEATTCTLCSTSNKTDILRRVRRKTLENHTRHQASTLYRTRPVLLHSTAIIIRSTKAALLIGRTDARCLVGRRLRARRYER